MSRPWGADIGRQAHGPGASGRSALTIPPVVLGAGKRLLCGFGESLDLEYLHVRQAPCDTHITDRLIR
jgi:hypothetical protein